MTYTHLNTDELVMIEAYYYQNIAVTTISGRLKRSRMTIYNVINFLKEGHTALEYYQQYKQRCGRRKVVLPEEQQVYITEKVAQGWTPDVIIGRKEMPIACSMRTLYRRFKEKMFDKTTLPMKGNRNQTAIRNVGQYRPSSGISLKGRPIIRHSRKNLAISKAIPLFFQSYFILLFVNICRFIFRY